MGGKWLSYLPKVESYVSTEEINNPIYIAALNVFKMLKSGVKEKIADERVQFPNFFLNSTWMQPLLLYETEV